MLPENVVLTVEPVLAVMFPAMLWPEAEKVTVLLVLLPDAALRRFADASGLVIFTPERVTAAFVPVTLKMSPLSVVMCPPVIVKEASPEIELPIRIAGWSMFLFVGE